MFRKNHYMFFLPKLPSDWKWFSEVDLDHFGAVVTPLIWELDRLWLGGISLDDDHDNDSVVVSEYVRPGRKCTEDCCGLERSASASSLLCTKTSTMNKVRKSKWTEYEHKKHELLLLPRVLPFKVIMHLSQHKNILCF